MPRSKLEPWGFFLAHVLRNGRYSKNCENLFKNIIVFCPLPRAKVYKNTFFEKSGCFTAPIFFICNYLTAMQYTIGNSDGSRGANPAMVPLSKLVMEFGPLGGRKSRLNDSTVNMSKSKDFGPVPMSAMDLALRLRKIPH